MRIYALPLGAKTKTRYNSLQLPQGITEMMTGELVRLSQQRAHGG